LRADNDLQEGAGDSVVLKPNGIFRSFPHLTTLLVHGSAHYLERAEECRVIAEATTNPNIWRLWIGLAATYARLAEAAVAVKCKV
jgi:hypothetical protein